MCLSMADWPFMFGIGMFSYLCCTCIKPTWLCTHVASVMTCDAKSQVSSLVSDMLTAPAACHMGTQSSYNGGRHAK